MKQVRFPYTVVFALLLGIFSLAACSPAAGSPSASPTAIVIDIPAASQTPQPIIPSEAPATAVPTEPPAIESPAAPVIEHLAGGLSITLTSIDMLDAANGWGVGGEQAAPAEHVLLTQDGGLTWRDVTPPEPAAEDGSSKTAVGSFLDASTAWVTYYSTAPGLPGQAMVWRTEDGGATWKPGSSLDLSDLVETYQVSDLLFIDRQNGWLLAHVGVGMNHDYVVLFRSTDGGLSWTRLIDPYIDGGIQSCSKTGLQFVDAQVGWLTMDCNGVAAGAYLHQTLDGGSTWSRVDLPEPAGQSGMFSATVACGTYFPHLFTPQSGLLAMHCINLGQSPPTFVDYLYTTQNGGATWSSAAYPGGEQASSASADTTNNYYTTGGQVLFITPQIGWALGYSFAITTDGGNSWATISNVNWVGSFDFVDPQHGWAIARSGGEVALVASLDGGVTWSLLQPASLP